MANSLASFLGGVRKLVEGQDLGRLSDQDLLQRYVHAQDEAAFAALLERHGPMVLGVCRRVLADEADVEDCFQGTFLVLLRKAAAIRKRSAVGCWLHGVAHRLAVHARAARLRRRQRENQAPAPAPSEPGEDITWRELRTLLDEELRRLPERYRAPLVLCYLQGQTRDEAARQLGVTVTALKGRLERGRDRLRRRLERRGLALSAPLLAALLDQGATAAPAPLVVATLKLTTAAGSAPVQVVALAEWMVKDMLRSRMRTVVGTLLGLVLLGSGAGLLARGAWPTPAPGAPAPFQADTNKDGPTPPRSDKQGQKQGKTTPVPRFDRELFTLRGPGGVTALAFAPDGRGLASAHANNVVLWDLASRKAIQRWQAPRDWGSVLSVAVAPDNSAVAIAGRSGPSTQGDKSCAAQVLDIRTGKVLHRLGHPQESCRCVAFSPDGTKLAFGGDRFLLFDAATGKLLWHAYAPRTPFPGKPLYQTKPVNVCGLAFAPDGKRLATISVFNSLTLWTADGKEIAELAGQRVGHAPREAFAFAPDGKTLAWRQPDRSVLLLDGHTGKKLRTLAPPKGARAPEPRGVIFPQVAFAANGAVLVSGEWDVRGSLVVVYGVATGKEIQRLEGKDRPSFQCLALSPRHPVLALGGPADEIRFLVPAAGEPDFPTMRPADAARDEVRQAFLKACRQVGQLEGKHPALLKGLSKVVPKFEHDIKGLERASFTFERNAIPPGKRPARAKDPGKPFVFVSVALWRVTPGRPGQPTPDMRYFRAGGISYGYLVTVFGSDTKLPEEVRSAFHWAFERWSRRGTPGSPPPPQSPKGDR
jgi:RNA polymerase sigma factor (sigma-70 family)